MMSTSGDSMSSNIKIGEVTQHWAEHQKLPVKYFPQIDSTNSKAKSDAFSPESLSEHLIVYITENQTAGKGRGQNKWHTAQVGTQLLSTWSFMIESAPQPIISPMIGLALYRAAMVTWPFLNWNLKAPNDLYLDDKKAAGILLETISQGDDHRLLIGLGLNVVSAPAEVENSVALAQKLSKESPLLAQDWISFLERLLFEFSFSIQLSFEPMNTTSTMALLNALNRHPLLSEKYLALDENGNLSTSTKKISWHQL